MGMGSMISLLEQYGAVKMNALSQVKAMLYLDHQRTGQRHSTYLTSTAPMASRSMALMQSDTAAGPYLLQGM